jgi:hypothetical protein
MLVVVLVGCNKENDPEEQKLTIDTVIESVNAKFEDGYI